jgi:hypothetical protein
MPTRFHPSCPHLEPGIQGDSLEASALDRRVKPGDDVFN